jgi:hypothetical protein
MAAGIVCAGSCSGEHTGTASDAVVPPTSFKFTTAVERRSRSSEVGSGSMS